MCAKKLINERKITTSLNRKAAGYSLVGVFGDKAYLSNGFYALIVSMSQIKNGSRLWKMIQEAVEFAGGREKIVREDYEGRKSVIGNEPMNMYLDIFHKNYGWDNRAVYTGKTQDGVCIVKNGNGTIRGFNPDYIDVIKDNLVLLEGIYGEGDISPLRYTKYNKDHDIEINYIVMPIMM